MNQVPIPIPDAPAGHSVVVMPRKVKDELLPNINVSEYFRTPTTPTPNNSANTSTSTTDSLHTPNPHLGADLGADMAGYDYPLSNVSGLSQFIPNTPDRATGTPVEGQEGEGGKGGGDS